ncbi:MAG: hypothetical protein NZ518_02170 [Dehalococcoidia bacterium]|nr:hypothetical protein [Dehalococcoidia bacterium]
MNIKLRAPLSWVLAHAALVTLGVAWLTWSVLAAPFGPLARALSVLTAVAVCGYGLADALLVRRSPYALSFHRVVEYLSPDMDQITRAFVFLLLPVAVFMFGRTTGLDLHVRPLLFLSWTLSLAIFFADMVYVLPPALVHALIERYRLEERS